MAQGIQFQELRAGSIWDVAGSTPGGNYCFRLYDNTASSVLDTYDVYAEASVAP